MFGRTNRTKVHHNHPNAMIHPHAQQQSKQTNRSSRYDNQHQNNYYRNNHNNNSNRRDQCTCRSCTA